MINVNQRGENMNTENMVANNIFADNFEDERVAHENQKYGRAPHPELAAHAHVYTKHSIEPAYGQYDRPINEIV
jgi:hypothetical protein